MEFLRDPIWQFVGAAVALVALFVSIYFFSAQRSAKSLAYEVLTRTELLSVKKEIKGKVQVLFESKPVENVYLVSLKIANDGQIPIAASHFERPLSFSFGENAMILSADVTEVFPQTLKPAVTVSNNRITLNPTLLNGGDTIQVACLLAQHDGTIQPDARIEGVSEVKRGINTPLKPVVRVLIAFAITSVVGIALVYIFVEPARIFINILAFAIVAIIIEVLTEGLNKRHRSNTKHRDED